MNLDKDRTTIKILQESWKVEKHCMQRHFCEHFNLPGHSGFLSNVSVTLIDKTDSKNPTKREDYWIHTLKTKAPLGCNVENCP